MDGVLVAKRGASFYRHALSSPGALAGELARHKQGVAGWSAVGAAAGAEGHRRSGAGYGQGRLSQNAQAVTGAVLGGGAGHVAYQAPGYLPKYYVRARQGHSLKRSEYPKPGAPLPSLRAALTSRVALRQRMIRPEFASNKSRDTRSKIGRRHHRAFTTGDKTDWKGFYRNYPKDLPYARVNRIIGHTHQGRLGTSIGAAATGAGAYAGYRHSMSKADVTRPLSERDQALRKIEDLAGIYGMIVLMRSNRYGDGLGFGRRQNPERFRVPKVITVSQVNGV